MKIRTKIDYAKGFLGNDRCDQRKVDLILSDASIHLKVDGSKTAAEMIGIGDDRYESGNINLDQLISNQRNKIQWSLNEDHGNDSK